MEISVLKKLWDVTSFSLSLPLLLKFARRGVRCITGQDAGKISYNASARWDCVWLKIRLLVRLGDTCSRRQVCILQVVCKMKQ